jgi:hypothetical protein
MACAAPPPERPAPGRGTVWGYLDLVPPDAPIPATDASYASPRFRSVRFVDYARPGFAVVYTDESSQSPEDAHIAIRSTSLRTRLEPSNVAANRTGRVVIKNESSGPHVISIPELGVLRRLSPGDAHTLAELTPGAYALHLPKEDLETRIFIAPGRFNVVSERGRFVLADLEPGPTTIHVWHESFPPNSQAVELEPDSSKRLDLSVGVGVTRAKAQ